MTRLTFVDWWENEGKRYYDIKDACRCLYEALTAELAAKPEAVADQKTLDEHDAALRQTYLQELLVPMKCGHPIFCRVSAGVLHFDVIDELNIEKSTHCFVCTTVADQIKAAVLAEAEAVLTHKFGECADGRDPIMCRLCDRIAALRSSGEAVGTCPTCKGTRRIESPNAQFTRPCPSCQQAGKAGRK